MRRPLHLSYSLDTMCVECFNKSVHKLKLEQGSLAFKICVDTSFHLDADATLNHKVLKLLLHNQE